MRSPLVLLVAALTVVALAPGAISCSSSNNDGTSPTLPPATSNGTPATAGPPAVDVNLTEYIVSPKPATAPAGQITFNVKNIGGTLHQFVILKTDLAPEALPKKSDGAADEAAAGVEKITSIPRLGKDEENFVTASLEAGKYVLICNILEEQSSGSKKAHYTAGMHAAFTVE